MELSVVNKDLKSEHVQGPL